MSAGCELFARRGIGRIGWGACRGGDNDASDCSGNPGCALFVWDLARVVTGCDIDSDLEWCLRMYPEVDLVRVELDLLMSEMAEPSSEPSVSARVCKEPEDCPVPLVCRRARLEDCECS